jgi:hypothetical protein
VNAAGFFLLAFALIASCDSSTTGAGTDNAPEICTRLCERVTAVGCDGYIEDDCVRGCSDLVGRPCWDVIEAEGLCEEQQPLSAYECTADGVPDLRSDLCTAESDAVRNCTTSDAGGTADAMAPLADAAQP